jgi:small conductance mechanosensitive channel
MPAEKSFKIRYDIIEAAKKAFDKAGIGIPFPQRDVHHYYPEGKNS